VREKLGFCPKSSTAARVQRSSGWISRLVFWTRSKRADASAIVRRGNVLSRSGSSACSRRPFGRSSKHPCVRSRRHISRTSAENGKAITQQTWAVVPKIREVDDLFRKHPALREIIREAHPEACFRERVGRPMNYSKKKREGQDEDRRRCAKDFTIWARSLIWTRSSREAARKV
jgi:Protein of unknown function (DUF429)